MSRKILILCFTLALALPSRAQEFVYTDAAALPLYGKVCDSTARHFSRLPLSMKETVRPDVWKLGGDAAGLYVRFCSDAGQFDFKWTSHRFNNLDNMTAIGVRGLALYVLDKGEWVYLATARPSKKGPQNHSKTIEFSDLAGAPREYMLYLSLYDGVDELEIGVPEGRTLAPSKLDSPRAEKPIIIYGTSILQGASASHPGLCGTALLSRRLDRTVVNLGFSGNCLLEAPIAEYMASFPAPGMYVIANWNGPAQIGRDNLEGVLRTLHGAHPSVPILVVDRSAKPACRFDSKARYEYTSKTEVVDSVFAILRAEGVSNLYHCTQNLLGEENSGTIEGTHYTDEAFRKWADAVAPVVKEAAPQLCCRKYSAVAPTPAFEDVRYAKARAR